MIDNKKRILKWASTQQRYHSEAMSKWGHYYEDMVADSEIHVGEPETYTTGRLRDIRRPILVPPSKPS